MVPTLLDVQMNWRKHTKKLTMRWFNLSRKVLERNPPAASHMGGIWERQIRSACAILSSLLSAHWKSLDEESLLKQVAETEGILNSQSLTMETISNTTSDLPFAPSNILAMKSKVVIPPPRDFTRPGLDCQKTWCHVQHLANEFWSCWRKEYLQSLQSCTKWQVRKRNFSVGGAMEQWPSG